MTEGSEPLTNAKHEAFALAIAVGEQQAPAYRRIWAFKGGAKTSHEKASRIASSGKVKARILWLRAEGLELAKKRARSTPLLIAEKLEFLAAVVRSKPREAGFDNPDCELVMTKSGAAAVFPSKLGALKLHNDLAGEGAEATGQTALAALAAKLRR